MEVQVVALLSRHFPSSASSALFSGFEHLARFTIYRPPHHSLRTPHRSSSPATSSPSLPSSYSSSGPSTSNPLNPEFLFASLDSTERKGVRSNDLRRRRREIGRLRIPKAYLRFG